MSLKSTAQQLESSSVTLLVQEPQVKLAPHNVVWKHCSSVANEIRQGQAKEEICWLPYDGSWLVKVRVFVISSAHSCSSLLAVVADAQGNNLFGGTMLLAKGLVAARHEKKSFSTLAFATCVDWNLIVWL